MNDIEIRTINSNAAYDLQEAKLITIGLKPTKRELSLDDIIQDIISEHSFLEMIHFTIKLKTTKDVRNQLVRHTKHHPRYACQSSRPDWTGKPRDDKEVYWLMQVNILALLRMFNQRLCTRTEKETREVMQEIKEVLLQSECIFQKAVGVCSVPDCVHRAGCPTGDYCNVWSDDYHCPLPERVEIYRSLNE